MPDRNPQFVNHPSQLHSVLEAVHRAPWVGVDTEFISENSYEPILCLLQIATPEGIWIVDPLAIADLRALWEALTSPDREFVALAAREEIRFCIRYAGRAPARLFDLQIAAGLLGLGYPLSHTNLVRKLLGVRVTGGEGFTDWRQRPLSPRQLEYSADDVRYLLQAREALGAEAERRGRVAWIEAECRRLVTRVAGEDNDERWRKVSGGSGLKRKDLAVLREVWRWRDDAARAANQTPRRILRDEFLTEIAKRQPQTVQDLFVVRGLDRSISKADAAQVVKAVQRALQLPEAEWPQVFRREDPPQVSVLGQLLGVAANNLAAEHEVDIALLATAADLQELVRWRLGLLDGDREPPILIGWRGEILGHTLLEILNGERSVRVGNVKRPSPLLFEAVQR